MSLFTCSGSFQGSINMYLLKYSAFWKAKMISEMRVLNFLSHLSKILPPNTSSFKETYLFIFNYRIIALQYCVGSAMQQHESAIGVHMSGLHWWLSSKDSIYTSGAIGEAGLIPGSGKFPGGKHGNALQYSSLENPTDRGAWQLQSKGSHRAGHDWSDLACRHAYICLLLLEPPSHFPHHPSF